MRLFGNIGWAWKIPCLVVLFDMAWCLFNYIWMINLSAEDLLNNRALVRFISVLIKTWEKVHYPIWQKLPDLLMFPTTMHSQQASWDKYFLLYSLSFLYVFVVAFVIVKTAQFICQNVSKKRLTGTGSR